MRPVLRGLCSYESIATPGLTLSDVALMNEALDVSDENQWRAREAERRG